MLTWFAGAFVGAEPGAGEHRARRQHERYTQFYRPVWDALVARGWLEELPAFERALADVQGFVGSAPVDEVELAEIHLAREEAARHLEAWLEERRKELAPVLDEQDLVLLGLGDLVPPPFEGRSAFLLQEIEIPART